MHSSQTPFACPSCLRARTEQHPIQHPTCTMTRDFDFSQHSKHDSNVQAVFKRSKQLMARANLRRHNTATHATEGTHSNAMENKSERKLSRNGYAHTGQRRIMCNKDDATHAPHVCTNAGHTTHTGSSHAGDESLEAPMSCHFLRDADTSPHASEANSVKSYRGDEGKSGRKRVDAPPHTKGAQWRTRLSAAACRRSPAWRCTSGW